jgi:NADH:ubiquinone oxidoreductase subunit 5 (subunit L)/multisubunit Na+/H+ antiporter MnhA subunit
MANQVVHGPVEIKSKSMKTMTVWMFVIGMVMWVGVPAYCLAVPAALYNDHGLVVALLAGMIGALVMIVLLVRLLGKLNHRWQDEYEELNERRAQRTPLEPMMVISVLLALVIFGIWFGLNGGGSMNSSNNI